MPLMLLSTIFLLAGCASIKGVEITDSERLACEVEKCSVWTEKELAKLAIKFWNEGYQKGVKSI